jgi:uncharacterized protein YkwD
MSPDEKKVIQLIVSLMLVASMLLAQAGSQNGNPATIPPEAWQIVQLVNQARAEVRAGPLQWDTALAEAARQHCLRMAAEESAEHQYDGEPALTERAAQAGMHFSLIAESVAVGSALADIHGEWMRSPDDRYWGSDCCSRARRPRRKDSARSAPAAAPRA